MKDPALLEYIGREMQGEGLPAIIQRIRDRQAAVLPSALVPGNTDGVKHEIQTLNWVIDMIVNFKNHVESDTDGETAAG